MQHWMIWTVLGMLLVRCSEAWARTWTDNTGKHKVEALLVEVKDGKVFLKKTGDGNIVVVPLNRLSVADRRYLSSRDNSDSPSQQTVSQSGFDDFGGEKTLTLQGHTDRVESVAFSPDGRRIVSGSWDKTVKVWDASSGEEILTLKGRRGKTLYCVYSVAFSPDGRRIVSGDQEHMVRVWDARSGEETLTLEGHTTNVTSVAFNPDGRRIVSGSWDKTVKIW